MHMPVSRHWLLHIKHLEQRRRVQESGLRHAGRVMIAAHPEALMSPEDNDAGESVMA